CALPILKGHFLLLFQFDQNLHQSNLEGKRSKFVLFRMFVNVFRSLFDKNQVEKFLLLNLLNLELTFDLNPFQLFVRYLLKGNKYSLLFSNKIFPKQYDY